MGTAGVKLAVRGYLPSGDEWRNIFYYTGEGDWTNTTISNWCVGLYSTLDTSVVNSCSIYGVDAAGRLVTYPDTDPEGWGASEFISVSHTFGGSGEPLPPGDAYVVIGQTGVKHVMARKFIPGPGESMQHAGIVEPTHVSNLNAFGTYWGNPTASPLSGVVTAACWGPTHGFVPLIGHKVTPRMYHLRRRQQGRGI